MRGDSIQLALFPVRVTLPMQRRIARAPGDVRWRTELLSGVVVRAWRNLLLVQFDGRRRDGSARGCLVQVPLSRPRKKKATP